MFLCEAATDLGIPVVPLVPISSDIVSAGSKSSTLKLLVKFYKHRTFSDMKVHLNVIVFARKRKIKTTSITSTSIKR